MQEKGKYGPDPDTVYPMEGFTRLWFLKNIIKNPKIIVGDYTYYDDNDNSPEKFMTNVLYHYDFIGDKLIIGKFYAIASDVKFIMNGANHKMKAFTSYPFGIFRVVTKDVPPYTIVGGNPAAMIRKRFSGEVIECLQDIKWWDWSIERITENMAVLCSDDIEKLKEVL